MGIVHIDVKLTGPLHDSRVQQAVDRGLEDAKLAVARQGEIEVRTALYEVAKHTSGRYGRALQVDRLMGDPRVTDGGIVYGPWLAGTGGRNHKSRFKGYNHWRRAVQKLQRAAGEIASKVIGEHLGRL